MKPRLGLKSYNISYKGEDKINFDNWEILITDPKIGFNAPRLKKFGKKFPKGSLSAHTRVNRLFTEKEKDALLLEIHTLKAEILACKYIGIKDFIVHLKDGKLNKKEEKEFSELIKFAIKRGVNIIPEMNCFFNGRNFLYNLSRFPKLKVNLDIGHLNTAIKSKTLGMPLGEFISGIKDKIVYLHIHNNNGLKDEHKSLDKGTLDWKSILDLINFKKIRRIIIECRTSEDIKKTKKLLEDYLRGK